MGRSIIACFSVVVWLLSPGILTISLFLVYDHKTHKHHSKGHVEITCTYTLVVKRRLSIRKRNATHTRREMRDKSGSETSSFYRQHATSKLGPWVTAVICTHAGTGWALDGTYGSLQDDDVFVRRAPWYPHGRYYYLHTRGFFLQAKNFEGGNGRWGRIAAGAPLGASAPEGGDDMGCFSCRRRRAF